MIALFERVLAFGYTGAAKVLLKAPMQALWTLPSLLGLTTPMVNPSIIRTQGGDVLLHRELWPLTSANLAATASDRAMSLTYSSHLAEVSGFNSYNLSYFIIM